jgi:hypothetical protein
MTHVLRWYVYIYEVLSTDINGGNILHPCERLSMVLISHRKQTFLVITVTRSKEEILQKVQTCVAM